MTTTRPLTAEEATWKNFLDGNVCCEESDCSNDATHIRSVDLGPGVCREWFVCDDCAQKERDNV